MVTLADAATTRAADRAQPQGLAHLPSRPDAEPDAAFRPRISLFRMGVPIRLMAALTVGIVLWAIMAFCLS